MNSQRLQDKSLLESIKRRQSKRLKVNLLLKSIKRRQSKRLKKTPNVQSPGKKKPVKQRMEKKSSKAEEDGEPTKIPMPKEEKANDAEEIEEEDREPEAHKSRFFRLLREDEDPVPNGIRARNPQAQKTLIKHVLYGSYYISQYISCSETLRGAIKLGRQNRYSDLIRIAVIDAKELAKTNGIKIYDLKALLQCLETDETGTADDKCTAVRNAEKFEEVVIEGNIGQECIVEVFQAKLVQCRYQPPVYLYIKNGCFEESETRKTEIYRLLGLD